MKPLFHFHGGIHPPQHKSESAGRGIVPGPLPKRLVLPLHQHIGAPARAIVKPGDRVLKGQMIGQPQGPISAGVHAPTSGTIHAVGLHGLPHPSGLHDLCIELWPDQEDRWIERQPIDYRTEDATRLLDHLRNAGVVGLGGAVFPSAVKLNPGPPGGVPTLIINGAECEPWITCDDALMRERSGEIVEGILIMRHLLDAREILIGIEDNKPEAAAAMRKAAAASPFPMEVVVVPTIYPTGGAKQLTQILTGKEAPSSGRSSDIGVACFNVATAYTVHRAVNHGEPVLSRVVTVTGNVGQARNFDALIGTLVPDLVALAQPRDDTDGFIMGGPLMGHRLPSLDVPVVKAMNCLIATSPALFKPAPRPMPCIRCGRCAAACPANLQPQDLHWFAKAANFGKAQEYALFDCIECGCCSYVCPSHIPLVQYFRHAKGEIWAREREKRAADIARERHTVREDRLAREKKERAERLAQKAAAAATPTARDGAATQSKDDALRAAIERAKAKKAEIVPKNTDNLPPSTLSEIEKIEARRAQLRKAATKSLDESED
ncbi:MAG: electron transport complex subunit RsxC [Betaproteobacteria bacterium]|nr:electron transport complex subunit RsxC [Betaproteobacteria bacterium]